MKNAATDTNFSYFSLVSYCVYWRHQGDAINTFEENKITQSNVLFYFFIFLSLYTLPQLFHSDRNVIND